MKLTSGPSRRMLLIVVCLLVFSATATTARADYVELFRDNFTRADSGTVGGGWTEAELSGAEARIAGNYLKLVDSSSSNYVQVYQSMGTVELGPTYFFNTSVNSSDVAQTFHIEPQCTSARCWLIRYDGGQFQYSDNAGVSNMFVPSANTVYNIQVWMYTGNNTYSYEINPGGYKRDNLGLWTDNAKISTMQFGTGSTASSFTAGVDFFGFYNVTAAAPPPGGVPANTTVIVHDLYDDAIVTSVKVRFTNSTDTIEKVVNASGVATINYGGPFNFQVIDTTGRYFNYTAPFNVSNTTGTPVVNITGAHVSFNITNVIDVYLNNYTITSGAWSNSSQEIGAGDLLNRRLLLKPNATNYINVTKAGYLNQTFTINTTGADSSMRTLPDLYQTNLYINVSVGSTTSYVKNWTAIINGTIFGGVLGEILNVTGYLATVKAMWGNYTIEVTPESYSINSVNFTIGDNNTTKWLTVPVYALNSIYLNLLDEITVEGINTTMIIELISELSSNSYTTANGSIAFETLTPAVYTIRYQAVDGSYPQRDYYQTLVNQNYYDLTIYGLTASEGTPLIVKVVNTNGQALSDAEIQLRRYFVDSNTYDVVEMAKTSYNGQAYLRAEAGTNAHYKLAITYGGRTLLTSSPENYEIGDDGYIRRTITFNTGASYYQSLTTLPGISHSLTYNNATGTLSFSWNDPSGIVTEGCIYAEYANVTRWTVISGCDSGPTGNALLVLPNPEDTTYRYYAKLETSTTYSEYTIYAGWIEKLNEFTGLTGSFGYLLSFLIMAIMGIIGALISAVAAIALALAALIFVTALGMFPVGWAAVAGMVTIMVGVGIYLMRN